MKGINVATYSVLLMVVYTSSGDVWPNLHANSAPLPRPDTEASTAGLVGSSVLEASLACSTSTGAPEA
jgi:hypothetical protein